MSHFACQIKWELYLTVLHFNKKLSSYFNISSVRCMKCAWNVFEFYEITNYLSIWIIGAYVTVLHRIIFRNFIRYYNRKQILVKHLQASMKRKQAITRFILSVFPPCCCFSRWYLLREVAYQKSPPHCVQALAWCFSFDDIWTSVRRLGRGVTSPDETGRTVRHAYTNAF